MQIVRASPEFRRSDPGRRLPDQAWVLCKLRGVNRAAFSVGRGDMWRLHARVPDVARPDRWLDGRLRRDIAVWIDGRGLVWARAPLEANLAWADGVGACVA